jgi:hypothetical protein
VATPSINTVPVPASMSTRGQYRFNRQKVGGVNGNGVAQEAGSQSVVWQFSYFTAAELAWWQTTIMSGELSLSVTLDPAAFELWNDLMAGTSFTSGVLYRPTYESYTAGLYRKCTIEIKHLLPLI